MNLQSLIVVVLRLMALNFLLQVAVQVTPQVIRFLKIYEQARSPVEAALPWLILLGLVVSAVLLWMLALPIARLVTRRVPQDVTFGAMSLTDCYSVAFIGIGLLYIASHLPQVLNWSHYLFKAAASRPGTSWKEEVDFYQVTQAFIPFIVGVVLFVNGRSWAVALSRRQGRAESLNQTVDRTGAQPPASDAP
jgi:hypothetical protein